MTAFATSDDLAVRLNRTFTSAEEEWVTALLEDAADYMRGVMLSQVYPATQSTYTAYPVGGRVDLPQNFVQSVDAVERDGEAVEYTRRQDSVLVDCDEAVEVTFTYGLAAAPRDLIAMNCTLVSQMMQTVTLGLGLSGAGLSSVAIDDFRAGFADGGAGTGMSLTPHATNYLVSKYGRSAWVVDTR
jgi:hypothetical protein